MALLNSSCDYLIIGGGMAGLSAAFELSGRSRVVVLEREDQAGYHATGRSAAMFIETYGNETIRSLTRGSRQAYETLQPPFGPDPVFTPRGAVFIAGQETADVLREHFATVKRFVDTARWIEGEALQKLVPCLKPGQFRFGAYEPDARDLHVHAILSSYIRGMKANNGVLHQNAGVDHIERVGNEWRVETRIGQFRAAVLVNAAGAWGGEIAVMAGIAGVGLVPMRRTGVIVAPPAGLDPRLLPYVGDIAETFYIKPEGRSLFVSPCDEMEAPPSDVSAEDYDVAVAMHRLSEVTTISARLLSGKLAGLRSFVKDRTPVVGYGSDGFFWLVGQGGYGIQTAPALARICAALAEQKPIPSDLQDFGVTAAALSPLRNGLAAT